MKSLIIDRDEHHKAVLAHASLFGLATLSFILFSAFIGQVSLGTQLLILLALLPVLGIPHGALDVALARHLFHNRYPRWRTVFVMSYLTLMAIVLWLWWLNPAVSFSVFLLVTLFHFGWDDSLVDQETPRWLRWMEIVGRGGVVLTFPALFSSDEVGVIFNYLTFGGDTDGIVTILKAAAPLCALCLGIGVAWSLNRCLQQRSAIALARAIELAVLPVLFLLLPPLLAFALYFNGLHSVRHMMQVAAMHERRSTSGDVLKLVKIALPVTGATLLLAVVGYAILQPTLSYSLSSTVQVIFIGIASMTYPHMLMVWLAERSVQAAGSDPSPRQIHAP